jgi:hypothetical protein
MIIENLKSVKLNKEFMENGLKSDYSKPLSWFKTNRVITVNNKMQSNYTYTLTFNPGEITKGLDLEGNLIEYKDFKPKYSPQQILRMGAFEGKYCNDQIFEFPREWYQNKSGKFNSKKFSPEYPNIECNYFNIKSRQSLQEWRRKKWIPCANGDNDTRGWFEWYCRYWLGRRQFAVDDIQIKRWKAFKRHYGQYIKNTKGHIGKHPKRRQALLQWSYPCVE